LLGGDQGPEARLRFALQPLGLLYNLFFKQKFPLSPPDVSTSYMAREIQATRGGTLMGEKE
jgi:hypothetical protein